MKQKIANIVLGILLSFNVFAADNSIYLDQSGNNSTIAINQDGYGNVVRGIQPIDFVDNTTPAKIYGIGNVVSINQIGINNSLSMGISTTIGGVTSLPNGKTVAGPVVNYTVTGNNATAVIDSNNSGASAASVSNYVNLNQTGNFAKANVNVLGANNAINLITSGGDSNSVVSTIKGTNNSQNVSLTGGGNNSTTINQGTAFNSNNNTVSILSVGVADTFSVNQSGGQNGNSLNITGYAGTSSVGNSNTVSVNQSGSNDNTAVIAMTGNYNTISLNQSSSLGGNIANLKINGSSNTFAINQTNR